MVESGTEEFALLDYLDSLVEDLRAMVPQAVQDQDVDAVHDARVSTRRLKAATELLSAVLSGRCRKPFARVGKRLRQQLGPLRDLDVMLEHTEDLSTPKYVAAAAWLIRRLKDCRQIAAKEAQNKIPPARILAKLGSWWGLRQEIRDAREAVGSLIAESVHLQLDAFAEQADAQVAAASAPPSSAKAKNDPHELRIAGKSLRYTLEMAQKHGIELPKSVLSLFKRLQESLGIWHDYVVLTERMLCETVECDLALHDPTLQAEILGLAQVTIRKSQIELKKVASLWSTKGEELKRITRAKFPLTRPASLKNEQVGAASEKPLKSEPSDIPSATQEVPAA